MAKLISIEAYISFSLFCTLLKLTSRINRKQYFFEGKKNSTKCAILLKSCSVLIFLLLVVHLIDLNLLLYHNNTIIIGWKC